MIQSLPLLLISTCVFACMPFFVAAQGIPQGVNISINSNPNFPEPFTPTKLTLEAFGTAVLDEHISWYIDGEPYISGTRSISLTTKGVGESTHVSAVVSQGALPFSVEKTITPSVLTILLETSVPSSPFIKEKMGIPAETPFMAIAHLDQGKKTTAYSYRWELGQGNAGTISGQRVSLNMPLYETLLSVTVTDEQGTLVHQGGTRLIPQTPHLSIYPYMNGVASHFPISNTYIPLRDTETFLASIRHGSQSIPKWFLSGTALTNLENPHLLTLGQLLTAQASLRIEITYGPFNTLTAQKSITITQ